MRCLVLGARRYSFKDDDGDRVEGAKLHYLTLDAIDGEDLDSDQRGEIPFEVSAPFTVFDQLGEVPAFYDVDFRQRPGRGGRPTLQVAGVSYLGACRLGESAPALLE